MNYIMVNETFVGSGEVYLIAGGGKTFSDVAAKFCKGEKDIESIIGSAQSKKIIKDLIESGHKASLEFDEFIFGIDGYSRVCEIQLVRKRHASYNISSGRDDRHGKRHFDVVIPQSITGFDNNIILNPEKISLKFANPNGIANVKLNDCFPLMKQQFGQTENPAVIYNYNYKDILNLIESWYETGVSLNLPEEDLRYLKPQATRFKAAVKMNAAGLRDWARIRMCFRAQTEIRDLCTKMINLAKSVSPEIMEGVGPACACDGYCSETEQCEQLKGIVPTKKQVLSYVKEHMEDVLSI